MIESVLFALPFWVGRPISQQVSCVRVIDDAPQVSGRVRTLSLRALYNRVCLIFRPCVALFDTFQFLHVVTFVAAVGPFTDRLAFSVFPALTTGLFDAMGTRGTQSCTDLS